MDIQVNIGTVAGFTDNAAAEVRENILTLVSTPMGTCPGDRGYGFDYSILDRPHEVVCGAIMIELMDKIEVYEPRAELTDIDFDIDSIGGSLTATLHLCAADSDTGEDIYTYSDAEDANDGGEGAE